MGLVQNLFGNEVFNQQFDTQMQVPVNIWKGFFFLLAFMNVNNQQIILTTH